VGNRVKIGGCSGIHNNVEDGAALMGYPAFELSNFIRSSVAYKKLPEMYSEMGALRKEIESLKEQLAAMSRA
jgi:UDP-3-O-[3-hydroxymyristoyl] glucosamine N-acyltransferase